MMTSEGYVDFFTWQLMQFLAAVGTLFIGYWLFRAIDFLWKDYNQHRNEPYFPPESKDDIDREDDFS
jgi:hypothetical protein